MSFSFDPLGGGLSDEKIAQIMKEIRSSIRVLDLEMGEDGLPYVTLGRQMVDDWADRCDVLGRLSPTNLSGAALELATAARQVEINVGPHISAAALDLSKAARQLVGNFDMRLFYGAALALAETRRVVTEVNRRPFSTGNDEPAATYADEPTEPSFALEDFREAFETLRRQKLERPFPQEIWFVDKEADYMRFRLAFETDTPSTGFWPPLGSIPIYTWMGKAEMARCKTTVERKAYIDSAAHVPFWGMLPGIWIKLSNGRIHHVDDVTVMIDALKAAHREE